MRLLEDLGSKKRVGALAGVGLAALLIGCGGGGGGGGGSSTDATTVTDATTATTSTTSTTSGNTGLWPANRIVYGVPNDVGTTFDIRSIAPDGTGTGTIASGISTNIVLFALNPATRNQYVFAADPTGSGLYGIYRGASLSTTAGATTLVTPVYSGISSLTVTQDGQNVVYSAAGGSGESHLYVEPVSGGSPIDFGFSDASAVSPADSDTVAYLAPSVENADVDQVFLRRISDGPGGLPNQLTVEPANHILPAFSRDGKRLAYWLQTGESYDAVIRQLGTDTAVVLPNPNNVIPQGIAFNTDGSRVVIAGDLNGTGQILTQASSGTANPVVVTSASGLLGSYGVFWTDASGRLVSGGIGASGVTRRKR